MSIVVRPGRMEDLFDLVGFTMEVARESEGLQLDKATVQNSIGKALQDPHKARYFVLEETDGNTRRLLGSCYVTFEWSDWRGGWYWWIQAAYVLPARRREGLFQRLYDAVHDAARQAGDVLQVRLYVEVDNTAGLGTYRSLGMAEAPYRVFTADVAGR